MSDVAIRRALLSVSDKTGLVEFARGLADLGVTLISTGGTRKALASAGLAVTDVSDVTGFPEMLDGRVKTLHPRIHAGLLAVRNNPEHMATLSEHRIEPIDLVIVNLYPFEQTVARAGSTREEIIENIDVGGPSMIRAAAKNLVAVVTDPRQYDAVLAEMRDRRGALSQETRQRLASAAFACTAAYDSAIANYFLPPDGFPDRLLVSMVRRSGLRYGENPHQRAAFYVDPSARWPAIAAAEILHGKELSYNNILDLDSAWNLVREFAAPAACVIKHNNPCGAAVGETPAQAYGLAYAGDPLSAFGGILAFNRPVDAATAELIAEPNRFIEAIIAPDYVPAALEVLTTKPKWGKNLRLLRAGPSDGPPRGLDYRRVDGGLLVQERDAGDNDFADAKVVTQRQPTDIERADLMFAWLVGKHVKSNAIVLARGRAVVGVGAGQMSRVDSTDLAVRKAGERARGAVLASDAFFPFRDSIDAAARAGITAVVQPGGSVRDAESIAACDEHGIAMIVTGIRHFRH